MNDATTARPPWRKEGAYSTLEIVRPRDRLVVVTITGTDVGELGQAPFQELAHDLVDPRPLEMFVDTRGTRGVSLDVSKDWTFWLRNNRARLSRVTMLPGTRFVRLAAEMVIGFAELGERMYVTTDPAAFDAALAEAIRRPPPG